MRELRGIRVDRIDIMLMRAVNLIRVFRVVKLVWLDRARVVKADPCVEMERHRPRSQAKQSKTKARERGYLRVIWI